MTTITCAAKQHAPELRAVLSRCGLWIVKHLHSCSELLDLHHALVLTKVLIQNTEYRRSSWRDVQSLYKYDISPMVCKEANIVKHLFHKTKANVFCPNVSKYSVRSWIRGLYYGFGPKKLVPLKPLVNLIDLVKIAILDYTPFWNTPI